MNDCAESGARIAKAYISDMYSNIATVYNRCKATERAILRQNIHGMLDRVKALLEGNEPEPAPEPQPEPEKKKPKTKEAVTPADAVDIQNDKGVSDDG